MAEKIKIEKWNDPHGVGGAKRANVAPSEWLPDWFVGYGKDESCQFEGTWWDMKGGIRMKILKPGKVELGKFTCPNCGCEFIATENEVEWYSSTTVKVFCPQDGCREHFEADWEPYEEPTPTQTDRERDLSKLRELVIKWRSDNTNLLPMAEYLLSNGVTFREE